MSKKKPTRFEIETGVPAAVDIANVLHITFPAICTGNTHVFEEGAQVCKCGKVNDQRPPQIGSGNG